jgi:hypothetical protein
MYVPVQATFRIHSTSTLTTDSYFDCALITPYCTNEARQKFIVYIIYIPVVASPSPLPFFDFLFFFVRFRFFVGGVAVDTSGVVLPPVLDAATIELPGTAVLALGVGAAPDAADAATTSLLRSKAATKNPVVPSRSRSARTTSGANGYL